MSAHTHTPAPWEVSSAGHGSLSGLVIYEYFVLNRAVVDDVAIAADIVDPATGMPSEANARLIAAAPELLEALIKADQMFRDIGFIAEADRLRPGSLGSEIRAAIAKATGGAA